MQISGKGHPSCLSHPRFLPPRAHPPPSCASCSSTAVITRYIAFRTDRYPASAGNAPIEASAGKISKFPSRVHRPSPEHRVIAKENGSPREIKDGPSGNCSRRRSLSREGVPERRRDAFLGFSRGRESREIRRLVTKSRKRRIPRNEAVLDAINRVTRARN